MKDNDKWDTYFLELAKAVSTKSKDRSTKVGCVITRSDHSVISSGYNGLPRGVSDDVSSRLERPEKYLWTEHAERNGIYSAAKAGVSVDGATLYSTLCPCCDCARAVIQSGIIRVVTHKDIPETMKSSHRWAESFKVTEMMFEEAKVRLDYVK
mgnify:CR=1 FL=1